MHGTPVRGAYRSCSKSNTKGMQGHEGDPPSEETPCANDGNGAKAVLCDSVAVNNLAQVPPNLVAVTAHLLTV